MPAITLPIGQNTMLPVTYSRDALIVQLKQLAADPATGYLSISSGDRGFLLFIFQGRPYAAGLTIGEKPTPLTITNFCAQTAMLRDGCGTMAFFETDPVLLKCMLVFIQDEPAAKGPVTLINLEGMVRQIHEQAADALVILERQGKYNFFFFLDGVKTAAYWSDHSLAGQPGMTVDEQMLLYAFQDSPSPANAIIYQTLNTMESRDSANISLEGLVRLFTSVEDSEQTIAPGKLTAHIADQLILKVIDGQQAGITMAGNIPCVLGRKDTDIIINDPMVSKRHAAVQSVNGKIMLVDLHSTNGTTINSQPITQQELKQGDRIGIGQTLLLVETLNP